MYDNQAKKSDIQDNYIYIIIRIKNNINFKLIILGRILINSVIFQINTKVKM